MATTRLQIHWAKDAIVERKNFGDFHTTTIHIEQIDGSVFELELFSHSELTRIKDDAKARVVSQQEAA